MTVLVAAWGIRLTFNFARKGGYKPGGEDYRWPILREKLGPLWYQVFNFTFISPYQNALLLLICLPAWVALQHKGTPLGVLDAVAGGVFVVALIGEFIADQQQWNFHQAKLAARSRGDVVDPPFLTTGLWRFSRHPNFFCEQTQWWCVALFAVAASGEWVSLPTWLGAVLLTLLFQGSAWFTEWLTTKKYPTYAHYQATTGRQFPLPNLQVARRAFSLGSRCPREGAPHQVWGPYETESTRIDARPRRLSGLPSSPKAILLCPAALQRHVPSTQG
jgi:steroid 5-alpha reductase family enzyme